MFDILENDHPNTSWSKYSEFLSPWCYSGTFAKPKFSSPWCYRATIVRCYRASKVRFYSHPLLYKCSDFFNLTGRTRAKPSEEIFMCLILRKFFQKSQKTLSLLSRKKKITYVFKVDRLLWPFVLGEIFGLKIIAFSVLFL